MTPLVLGEHTYDITEGDDEKLTRVTVSRVDKGRIDVDIEEVMRKLSWTFPSDKFVLGRPLPDPSNEEIGANESRGKIDGTDNRAKVRGRGSFEANA